MGRKTRTAAEKHRGLPSTSQPRKIGTGYLAKAKPAQSGRFAASHSLRSPAHLHPTANAAVQQAAAPGFDKPWEERRRAGSLLRGSRRRCARTRMARMTWRHRSLREKPPNRSRPCAASLQAASVQAAHGGFGIVLHLVQAGVPSKPAFAASHALTAKDVLRAATLHRVSWRRRAYPRKTFSKPGPSGASAKLRGKPGPAQAGIRCESRLRVETSLHGAIAETVASAPHLAIGEPQALTHRGAQRPST